jgi:cystathionine gamma-lyase
MPHTIPSGHRALTNGYTNGHVDSFANGHANTHAVKKPHVDGFSTRAVHVGSDPDEATGAVIPAISLSTTYKQTGVGNHKVHISTSFKLPHGLTYYCTGF